VHCWVDLQSGHGLRCYGNIMRARNVSEYMLVLGVCLVTILLLAEIFCLAIDEITILLRAFVQAQVTLFQNMKQKHVQPAE